jgi:hypothetical protein
MIFKIYLKNMASKKSFLLREESPKNSQREFMNLEVTKNISENNCPNIFQTTGKIILSEEPNNRLYVNIVYQAQARLYLQ